MIEFDVIVDIEANLLPARRLKRLSRQRSERWFVEPLEQLAAARVVRAHRSRVDDLSELEESAIEVGEVREGFVTNAREQPSLGDLDADLDLGFVPRRLRSRRQDRGVVVATPCPV